MLQIYSVLLIYLLQDPKVYFYALYDVQHKYSEMVQQAFGGDSGFIQSLDKVYTLYIGASTS